MEYVVKLNCNGGFMTVLSVDENAMDEENSDKVKSEKNWETESGTKNIWERMW